MAGNTLSRVRKMTVAVLLCVSCLFTMFPPSALAADVRSAPLRTSQSAMNGMVRVYLASLGSVTSLDLTTSGSYSIGQGDILPSGTQIKVTFDSSTGQIALTYQGQKVQFGKEASLRRRSTDSASGIRIRQARESNNPYPGDLSFHAVLSGGSYTLYTVAHVYIENYLYGVLPYEMGNSSNIEALKAQAVAARTYTVRMMKARASGLYDVKDTTSDQVYRGTPGGNANCVSAVDATKGVVLMYGSNFITTYYSASNGGQTEISRTGTQYAYMTVKDDPFDYANPSSTVKKKTIYSNLEHTGNSAQLISLLKSKAAAKLRQQGYSVSEVKLGTLQSVTPHSPKYASPSRLYTKMDFTFSVSSPAVSSLTVTCDIFGELESQLGMSIQSSSNELWSVEDRGSTFELQARRYGHGLGMSQRGAMYMAKLGYSYAHILGFYYEGCERVKHSFTHTILNTSGDEEITVEKPTDDEMNSSSGCYGIVSLSNAKQLMIRNSASNDGSIIGTADNGAMLDVLAMQTDWCLVRYGAITGYVPASALQISGQPSAEASAPTQILGFVTVTANDFVNLRASGSMNAKIVGTAVAGSILTVFETNGSWAKVQHNALVAYVNTGFVSAVQSQYPSSDNADIPVEPPQTTLLAVVTTQQGSLNMRTQPYAGSQILTTIPRGEEIAVIERGATWTSVYYQGMSGHVMTSFLTFMNDDTTMPQEPSVGKKATVVTPSGMLNLRIEPKTGSGIIARIPPGEDVAVEQYGNEWTQVTWNGMSGYVMTTFLSFDEQPDNETPEPEKPDEDDSAIRAVVTTESGTLNLRAQPSQTSQVIVQISRNAEVSIIQYGDVWSAITWQGRTGYVMSRFLTFTAGKEDEPKDETDEVESETPSYQWAVVGTVSGGLNVRSQPSQTALVLGTLPRSQKVEVMAYGSEWCAVRNDALSGYVMTKFLRFQDDNQGEQEPSEQTRIAWVNTSSGALNLRSQPDANSQIVLNIPQYAQLSCESSEGTWTRVVYQGVHGYVMSKFLCFDEPVIPDDDKQQTPVIVGGVDITMHAPEGSMYAVPSRDTGITMRPGCVDDGEMIAFVPPGMQVEVVLIGEHWACIQYDGVQGYCKTELLSVIEP